jgi:hypothetical protein
MFAVHQWQWRASRAATGYMRSHVTQPYFRPSRVSGYRYHPTFRPSGSPNLNQSRHSFTEIFSDEGEILISLLPLQTVTSLPSIEVEFIPGPGLLQQIQLLPETEAQDHSSICVKIGTVGAIPGMGLESLWRGLEVDSSTIVPNWSVRPWTGYIQLDCGILRAQWIGPQSIQSVQWIEGLDHINVRQRSQDGSKGLSGQRIHYLYMRTIKQFKFHKNNEFTYDTAGW